MDLIPTVQYIFPVLNGADLATFVIILPVPYSYVGLKLWGIMVKSIPLHRF